MLRNKNYEKYFKYKYSEGSLLSYFHSVMRYGLVFGETVYSKSVGLLVLQKRAVRIITGANVWESCRTLFKKLKLLPLACEYILSLTNFIINNSDNFIKKILRSSNKYRL